MILYGVSQLCQYICLSIMIWAYFLYIKCIYESTCIHFNLLYSVMPWCFDMLSPLYVAGPHVKPFQGSGTRLHTTLNDSLKYPESRTASAKTRAKWGPFYAPSAWERLSTLYFIERTSNQTCLPSSNTANPKQVMEFRIIIKPFG